ncbi:RnfABCDGE type electron transport complex subunit G [Desulfonatronovibrio hydrogenovorans]|uniref:RnfABCDGE type electron transport complex subunit G n=1 Tax=Desulfonatronovibrio hydrogenovorans TaxID=53245 RepID=UPI000691FE58|nr:RnfABCDGE type electron transport complex subunit G [Desulfonatronovibrio hydrogenovorans]
MTRKDLIRMIFIMTLVTSMCGGALAMVKMTTRDQIEYQQIRFIKEPALNRILPLDYDNDPISDRLTIPLNIRENNGELTVFTAKRAGKVISVAFESFAPGYAGPVGVMLAIDPVGNELQGAAVTTHSETPGLGTRIIDVPSFGLQFQDRPLDQDFRLRSDGGTIQGITGATVSAAAMANAVHKGVSLFDEIKEHLELD